MVPSVRTVSALALLVSLTGACSGDPIPGEPTPAPTPSGTTPLEPPAPTPTVTPKPEPKPEPEPEPTYEDGAAFEPQDHVPYLVAQVPTQLVLEMESPAPASRARPSAKTGRASQLFTFTKAADATFTVRNHESGLLLQTSGTAAGLPAIQGPPDPGAAFHVLAAPGGTFRFVNARSRRCLTQASSGLEQRNCVPLADAAGATQRFTLFPAKKGVALTTSRVGWESRVSSLQGSWHYSWSAVLQPTRPAGLPFTPMIWGYYGATPAFQSTIATLTQQRQQGLVTELLGLNEPDGAEQANVTVARALEAWPALESTGLRLGSPAAVNATNAWMQEFMTAVDAQGLRVDFVTVHWYGGANADALMTVLRNVSQAYGRPVWLTEFAPADWNATATRPNRYTPADIEAFMRKALPLLDAAPFVERYSWFSFAQSSLPGGPAALFDDEGNLTPLGTVYQKYPL